MPNITIKRCEAYKNIQWLFELNTINYQKRESIATYLTLM